MTSIPRGTRTAAFVANVLVFACACARPDPRRIDDASAAAPSASNDPVPADSIALSAVDAAVEAATLPAEPLPEPQVWSFPRAARANRSSLAVRLDQQCAAMGGTVDASDASPAPTKPPSRKP